MKNSSAKAREIGKLKRHMLITQENKRPDLPAGVSVKAFLLPQRGEGCSSPGTIHCKIRWCGVWGLCTETNFHASPVQ